MITKTKSLAPARGFTIIELMVVVTIIGILAAIAIPNYSAYVQRSRIIDATSRLSDFRVRMEQYFLDRRTYIGAGPAGCGILDPVLVNSMPFAITCAAADARNYVVTATGQASQNMSNFVYTINQNGDKITVNTGWGVTSGNCWVIRKDGSCI